MDSNDDPIGIFLEWFDAAQRVVEPEPAAATLATVSPSGLPTARVVLVRHVDRHGFVFYTNLESPKARDLSGGAHAAALCFYWAPLMKQVCIEGHAEPVLPEEADAYWASRPRGHQVMGWASPQSQPLPGGRSDIERRFAELDRSLPATNVPRPPFWSGFRIVPDAIEFWEGRENRLHHRVLFRRAASGWTREIIAP
ncbi:MAG TPA: pyridoxamine 5'-phosphate oxidase [Candidatus Eisenbacteria bacterium]|nr:pyridoxamine 5'-phosphate oxidase [Candidatus Eisenbacteria bacterium]